MHTSDETKRRRNPRPKRRCECSDPGCPVHRGVSRCMKAATQVLRRIDMEDRTGTRMCHDCAEDAYGSGLFD
jgi:DNA-binding IscR family transcriptional regulator